MNRCGHCKNLAPEYKLAAEKLAGMVTVGAVDCDADENKSLCATYGIQGFPTIKTFSAGIKGMPSDYQGPRTAAAIVKEGISKVKSFLKTCESKGFTDFVSSNDKTILALISQKDEVPVMFKALSAEFYNQVDLCYFKSTDKEIVTKAGISKFPSLVIFSKNKDPIVYDGPQKFKQIKEYMETFAINRKKGSEKKKDFPKKKPVCKKYREVTFLVDPKVSEISNQSQLDECLGKVGVCLISFLTLEPDYQESVESHAESLTTLSQVKKVFYDRNAPFTFVWVNSITHGRKLIMDFDIR